MLLPVAVLSALAYPWTKPLEDCDDIYRNGTTESGVYYIHPPQSDKPLEVYCDMDCHERHKDSHGGGWTVFQRRKDGTVNFCRPWKHYRDGFGDLDGEHWLEDDMMNSNGHKFSTFNKDQDGSYYKNMAEKYEGGFWHGYGVYANPNGLYKWGRHSGSGSGVLWSGWKGQYYSLKSIKLKIRPLSLEEAEGIQHDWANGRGHGR